MEKDKLIRFDWAMKRLLRDKANYVVLEGFLSTLLGFSLKINRLLESESNRDDREDKYNRVDVLAEDENGALYLIEVQNNNEIDYLQRMLFGTSKILTEYIKSGEKYANLRKVFSINIVYFDLGSGTDVVYHGTTEFHGIHDNSLLELSKYQMEMFKVKGVSDLYPEYYLLKVNDFNKWSKTPLDQWLYFLSNNAIQDDADAPGLVEARERMRYAALSPDDRRNYDAHIESLMSAQNQIFTAHYEGVSEGKEIGLEIGLKRGREEGRLEEKVTLARNLKKSTGLTVEQIATVTGLAAEQIQSL